MTQATRLGVGRHRHRSNVGAHLQLAGRIYPHGTRARYNAQKCRCFKCRRANTAYELQRQRDPRVCCEHVREHILRLGVQGIGLRAISDATDISRNLLKRILLGQPKVRRSIVDKLMAADATVIADGAFVDATETRRLLQALFADGYTRVRLLALLGERNRLTFQYRGGRVRASTALRIRKLYDALTAESEIEVPYERESGRGVPRIRVLEALALFSEVGAQELFDAMSLGEDARVACMQALHRLWKAGQVERLGDGKPYRYRVAPPQCIGQEAGL